jgi:PTS system glucitol/sorbitol-specific IIC component
MSREGFFMFLINTVQGMIDAGADQLLTWVTAFLPKVFLFLILLNALTAMIGRSRVERLAAKCGANPLLRYMALPFLSAVVLGNPMAISMGRYLPERYKPAYFASASYHCHTNSGIFNHINPAELFLWLGIADGVLARGQDLYPLALRYMAAGLVANFVSGYATEIITGKMEKKQKVRLERSVDLWTEREEEEKASAEAETETEAVREEPEEVKASPYRSVTIVRGDGGYGGPLTVTPTPERHKVLYMTGGVHEPEPLQKILALSGMEAVDGNKETCPDEEVALAIIDCQGTLRCGIYPGKGIPTVNILATGRSGPLAKYMTEDLYVSAVTSAQVTGAMEAEPEEKTPEDTEDPRILREKEEAKEEGVSDPLTEKGGEETGTEASLGMALEPVMAAGRVVSLFRQAASEAVKTCLEMILPFMGFAALFVGICKGSGLTGFLAGLIGPAGRSLPGLMILGIICSLPGLSAVLGAGAAAAQIFSTVIGTLIASGSLTPAMALPALFAINCQCACDFIPVGLGMTEARPETTQVGIAAVTMSRFATGWIRILIAVVFSIGLYR